MTKGKSPASAHVVEDQSEAIAFLSDPRTHALSEEVVRIDTHGAIVILAGPYAYKVKRAVRFSFLDYSTLEKRRAACEAEIAVNRSHAPDLYLGTIAITRGPEGLTLGGEGKVVEWAVLMRRFDLAATLDKVAEAGRLTVPLLTKLTRAVLASHARAPRSEGAPAIERLGRYIEDNDIAFRQRPDLFSTRLAEELSHQARSALRNASALLLDRGRAGFVRHCHGDLHLRNIVLLDHEPTLFDAIEFDDAVATGDVLYDLAFLLMDLWERQFQASANLVLNRYLWESDEANLTGLAALPLFLSIRAAIRAKVTAAGMAHLDGAESDRAAAAAIRYFECARTFLKPIPCRIVAIGGLSGSGKSTLAARIAAEIGRPPGAVHLRSDIERKQLFGVSETERLPAEAYRPELARQVYSRLVAKAARAAGSGYSVIVDAVFAREEERLAIEAMARKMNAPFSGLWLEAPRSVLLERVAQRRGDASDADARVVNQQLGYEIGSLTWSRMETAGSPESAAQAALAILATE
jgi:aminoglycoside phosphotransferase family enzyme/predicted kinase